MSPNRIVFVLSVCVLLSTPALADDGRIPIWEPTTIDTPGSYVLTRNVTSAAFTNVITIDTSGVDLDLNGFALTSPGTNSSNPVVLITASGGPSDRAQVTIRNGFLINGSFGVRMEDGGYGKIVLEDLVFQNGNRSIYLFSGACDQCRIANNVIRSGNNQAIEIGGGEGTIIIDNMIEGGGQGLYVGSAAKGFRVVGNTLRRGNGGIGAINFEGSGSLIAENVIFGCTEGTQAGIDLRTGDSNQVLRNTVDGCNGSAMRVTDSDFNLIEANLLNRSSLYGLWFNAGADNNVYRGNATLGNGTDFQDDGTGNQTHNDNYRTTGAY